MIVTRTRPTMYFFGVTTSQSSSLKVFPAWARLLGLGDAQLLGVDLPLDASDEMYRQAVAQIKDDPLSLGALVTTHKLNVVRAAGDLFDELSEDALLGSEVSCIYKRDGRLMGHVTDPQTSGQAMAHFLPADYWQRHRTDVLCLGAGGAAVALVTYFLTRTARPDRPRRMVLVDIDTEKLNHVRRLIEHFPDPGIQFEFVHNADARVNDKLLAGLPSHALVVNATGMGKDRPGSPLTGSGVFPEQAWAWEYNYRGERAFMHQALAQADSRGVQVEDGWIYFLHGWASVISNVFNVSIEGERFAQFSEAAEAIRPVGSS